MWKKRNKLRDELKLPRLGFPRISVARVCIDCTAFAVARRRSGNENARDSTTARHCINLLVVTMPSILQQQLQQVSSTWGVSTGQRQRGKPSLLYTAQEAADVDLQTLFEFAQEGEAMLQMSTPTWLLVSPPFCLFGCQCDSYSAMSNVCRLPSTMCC